MKKQKNQSVIQWSSTELSFESSEPLEWDSFPLSVRFVNGDDVHTLEGFWDGGTTWKVRFAPSSPGSWTWHSESTDPGLNNQSGSISCTQPTADQIKTNPNYHGFIKVAPDDRHFQYADGTTFFWLGDTIWSINTRRCGLGANLDGPFFQWLRDRKEKGFNLALIQYFRTTHQSNEGGYPFGKYPDEKITFKEINPDFFRYMDVRMDALWKAGFVVAGHPTWFGKPMDGTRHIQPDQAQSVSRYVFDRYNAYNIVYSLSGEYQYSYRTIDPPWKKDDWNDLGYCIHSKNTYSHPLTVHPSGKQGPHNLPKGWDPQAYEASSGGEFHCESWLNHNWLQTGHQAGNLWRIPMRIAENLLKQPPKPVVHSEGWYEDVHSADLCITCNADHVRWQAWATFLSGSAGHIYGNHGVWAFVDNNDPECDGEYQGYRGKPWQESILAQGGIQVQYVKKFLQQIPWESLEPHQDWLVVNGEPEPQATENSIMVPLCAAILEQEYILYLPKGQMWPNSYRLNNLGNAQYTAKWFNPRNGNYLQEQVETPFRIDDEGNWILPVKPDYEDWVLHLSAIKT